MSIGGRGRDAGERHGTKVIHVVTHEAYGLECDQRSLRERSQRRRLVLTPGVDVIDPELPCKSRQKRAVLARDEREYHACPPRPGDAHHVEEMEPLELLAVGPPPEPTVSEHTIDVEGYRPNLCHSTGEELEFAMADVILSEAKDLRHPGRGTPRLGTMKILRLTAQDDIPPFGAPLGM